MVGAQISVYIRETLTNRNREARARVALLEPFAGLAGDMLLGSLLELAVHVDPGIEAALREVLASLGLPPWQLEVAPVVRRSLGCTKATFTVPDERDHRHLPEIRERIAASALPARARDKADETFRVLAEAEARVHRVPVDHVHFHEVGAADAILDICAVSFVLDRLGVHELRCGPLPGGSGVIRCAHGDMPCPAPAVVHLLEDFVIEAGVGEGEMVTPTGAALLRAWGRPLAPGSLRYTTRAVGYGAGTRSTSALRLSLVDVVDSDDLGASPDGFMRDEVFVITTHLDDESPELLAWLSQHLFELGAVDVAFAPLTMKKGRPGLALTAIVPPPRRAAVVAAILRETSALGVREQLVQRTILARTIAELDTPWGPVRVKRAGGRARPEHDDLARVAREHGLGLREVSEAVAALLNPSGRPSGT